MIFGKGGSARAGLGARGAALSLWTVLVAGLGIALVTGCGGGGGGGGDNGDGGNDGGTTVTAIVGRVIENNTSAPVSAITVKFGNATTRPDALGNFRFEFPSGIPATIIQLDPDVDAQYHDIIYADTDGAGGANPTVSSLGVADTDGVSVPATGSGTERNIGDLRVFSTDGPPPPPSI